MRTTSDIGTAGRMRVKSDMKITEHEGMLLALVLRQQPVTAYQLFRFFETSPVTSINASKGQLYPAIRRLRERGLIAGRKVAGDGRGAEALSVTKAGEGAVRAGCRRSTARISRSTTRSAPGSCRSTSCRAKSACNGSRAPKRW